MNRWRSTLLVTVTVLIVPAIPCSAQVSCSAEVESHICKTVSEFMSPAVAAGVLTKDPLGVEIVSPAEYAKRKAAIQAADQSRGMQCVGCAPTRPDAPKYREFRNGYSQKALFLRSEDGREPFPVSLLISTDVFCGAVLKDGKVVSDGKFSVDTMYTFMAFVAGYFEGMKAVYLDGEVTKFE